MIDFVAGGFELIALYVLGNKNRYGFLLNVVGNSLWTYIAIRYKLYGLLLVVLPAIVLNIRNFARWRRNEKSASCRLPL